MSGAITTVQMRMGTRQLLRKIGRKEQTYDDLINELVARQELVRPQTCEKCGKTIKGGLDAD
jgi:hypothetical protein